MWLWPLIKFAWKTSKCRVNYLTHTTFQLNAESRIFWRKSKKRAPSMSVTLVKKFHIMKKFCWLQFLCWHHNLKAKIQGQTNGKNWAISCFLGFVCSSTFTRLCRKDFGIHMYGSIFAEWDDLTKLEANTSLRPVYSIVFHSFNVACKNGSSVAQLVYWM